MTLTPLDIEKFEMRTAWRGYAREDVERLRIEALHAVEEYLGRINALQARVAELERDLQQYRANEELLKSSVVLAQKTSDELIVAARQRAELIVREAEAEGEDIRRRLSDARNEREQFEYAFHGLLSGFLHRLEQGNPALRPAQHSAAPVLPGKTEGSSVQTTIDNTNQAAGLSEENVWAGREQPHGDAGASSGQPGFTDGVTEEAEDASRVSPAPAMPSRSAIPPSAPAMPRASQPAAVAPAPANERDADIGDFTAVLASAPSQPSPPRVNAIEHGRVYSVAEPGDTMPEPLHAPEHAAGAAMDAPAQPDAAADAAAHDPLAPAPGLPLDGDED